MGATDDAAELTRRAQQLRECAREARAIARSLGPYLDDAVGKAAPRADGLPAGFGAAGGGNQAGTGNEPIWLGPFADQCTGTLKQRQSRLGSMASALLADATRWESEASRLEGEAKAADAKAKSTTGGR